MARWGGAAWCCVVRSRFLNAKKNASYAIYQRKYPGDRGGVSPSKIDLRVKLRQGLLQCC